MQRTQGSGARSRIAVSGGGGGIRLWLRWWRDDLVRRGVCGPPRHWHAEVEGRHGEEGRSQIGEASDAQPGKAGFCKSDGRRL